MNKQIYSNKEFTELRKRLNEEILRRATFKWWDPLATPKVGEDKSSPLTLPDTDAVRIPVDDRTYTINDSSEGSIEPTRNIHFPANGIPLAGAEPEFASVTPNTSAASLTVGEIKNFLVGLSKINDINLFYGRDEEAGLAFRDPNGIVNLLEEAEQDTLHKQMPFTYNFHIEGDNIYMEYDGALPNISIDENGDLVLEYNEGETAAVLPQISFAIEGYDLFVDNIDTIVYTRNDPNGGWTDLNPDYPVQHEVVYPVENGYYVMKSGEFDGEEMKDFTGLGPDNFFDDYGAQPGDSNFHPVNPALTPITRRDFVTQDDKRNNIHNIITQGGRRASEFGQNPRNPQNGDEYKSRPVYRGTEGACNGSCVGLCYITCDDLCSESCNSTCHMRCGNACTSTCGNACTGCSSQCYTSCRTKCQNDTGYACVKSGIKSLKITEDVNGVFTEITTHTCDGCSYSCQFYPNKKTTCWDAGCMGKCFVACSNSCLTSCVGGCTANDSENDGSYKSGKGKGCSSNCSMNCIGTCEGTCEGQCTTSCFQSCEQSCSDNCEFSCSTDCGSGCANSCKNGCKGCTDTCESSCKGVSESATCVGCGSAGGCSSTCQFDCSSTCFNQGCKSMCGVDTGGACSANCRMNCTGSSCTSMCEDACSSACTTCANNCGFSCGQNCSAQCINTCDESCNITCSQRCQQSCELDCVQSCSEACGGCSELCYSCVGMCIGVCSVRCENGCSSCTNNCGFWCDSSCNQECHSSCLQTCLSTCSQSCSTRTTSEAHNTEGPERQPTSRGYKVREISNRTEEKEAFQILNRDKTIVVDTFRFHLEEKNLCIYCLDHDVIHLTINDEGYLILNDEGNEADNILVKYEFEVTEDQRLILTVKED